MKKRPQLNQPESNHTMAAQNSRNSLTVNAREAGRRPAKKPRSHSSLGRKLRIAGIVVGAFLLVCAMALYLVWRSLMGNIHVVDPSQETLPSEFNVPTESLSNPVPEEKGIYNILLLGVDTRDADSLAERSDSMMILTIDEINGKLKLTSLQRDMLIYMPGKTTPVKINEANARGGPPLALRVVNETLRLNLTDYMIVNMRGMEQLIELVGGVMIDVDKEEIPYLNGSVNEENALYPETAQSGPVTKSGLQLLNGRQAVAYARIRHLDSDYKRMERQRTVLQAMLNAFLKADLATKTNMMSSGLGLITTNVSATHLTQIGLKTLPLMNATIEQLQIPINGDFNSGYYGTSWCNMCDFNAMIPKLQKFIFGQTYAFDPVKEIPGAPNSSIKLPTPTPTKKPTATPTAAPTTAEQSAKPTTGTLAPTTNTPTTASPTTKPSDTTGTTKEHTKTTTAEETTKAATTSASS